MQLNVKTLFLYFFLLFFLRSSLAGSVELFHYYNLIFLYFQFSAVRPDHLSQAYFQKTVHKIHPTTDHPIGVQIRLTNPNTTPDNQTRPPNKTTIRSDRHGHTRLQDQMSPPDYCPWLLSFKSAQYTRLLSTPNLLKWYRFGAFLVGWVKGGYIEFWMNLAKHTIHTLSAWNIRTSYSA